MGLEMNAAPFPVVPMRQTGPVLLLSLKHRDELAATLDQLGWQVIASRRLEGIKERLGSSNACLILIDIRNAAGEALRAISALAPFSGPVLLVYDEKQVEVLAQATQLGITHMLRAPFDPVELDAALILASRVARPEDRIHNSRDVERDSLTGLAQLKEFRGWMSQAMSSGPTSLLLINVARFDAINAALGREVGDATLRAIAHRIVPLVSELEGCEHLIARMPGAEFAIGFAGAVSPERLYLLAEAIVESVSRPLATVGGTVRLGCRVVAVEKGPQHKTASSLIRQAGKVLGEIRDSDSGAIRLQLGEDAELAALSESLHSDLRAALSNNQIELLFQPQVGVVGGHIEGVEALARWRHPARGEIGAATLFAVAEQSNYMAELSAHIQRSALSAAARWPVELSHLRLSVNVTAGDIARPRFLKAFQSLIDESGFPRQRLTVEVTETGLMENLQSASRILAQLRASGCRVAIDDFGTGYSSLAWLKELPADYLKLDKGLSGEILGGERDSVVLRGVIGMARSLGLSVIAEGVETEGQLALLAREGCTLYQGFLCSPALDVAALSALIKRSR